MFLLAAIAIAAGIIYLAAGATYASGEVESPIYSFPPAPVSVPPSDSLDPMGTDAAGYGPDPSPDFSPAPAPDPLPIDGGLMLPPLPQTFSDSDVLDQAAVLIAGFETFSATAYKDDYKPTAAVEFSIGYGHQIKPGEIFTAITESQGHDLLVKDASQSWNCIKARVGGLTLNQCVALTSLCFNIGCSNFAGSTLLRVLKMGDLRSAAGEFSRWVYAGGVISQALVSRRRVEQNLFERV